jgi:hypothetical protein
MNSKKSSIALIIIAVILGGAIFRHFNFNTLTFEKPWLDALYIIVFISSLFLIFKKEGK